MRELDVSWIPARIKLGKLHLTLGSAVTLWPVGVFYRYKTPSIKAHEEVHWAEQRRCWGLPWFIAYLLLLPFFGGGRKHPLEKYAYHIVAHRAEPDRQGQKTDDDVVREIEGLDDLRKYTANQTRAMVATLPGFEGRVPQLRAVQGIIKNYRDRQGTEPRTRPSRRAATQETKEDA